MSAKEINKAQIALEDIAIGSSSESQTRASGTKTVNQVNSSDIGTKSASQVDLLDATSAVNTVRKTLGEQVWDSTNNRPVWAQGTTATAVWGDSVGGTVHTPS